MQTLGTCVKCGISPAIMQVTLKCFKCYKEDFDKLNNFIDNETKEVIEKEEEKIYLSCAETAKLVRKALKEKFPKQKFSVRSSVYSGGASIDVSWIDGIAQDEVSKVIKQFEGAGFDGSIDLKYYIDHWMLPNGQVITAKNEGTNDCRGYVKGYEVPKPHPDAKKVSFGADYVFSNRSLSEELQEKIARQIAKIDGIEFTSMDSYPKGFGKDCRNWWNIVWILTVNEDLTDFKKVVSSGKTAGSWEDFYVVTSHNKHYKKCAKCNILKPENKLYSYVDGNNIAITKNSPDLCELCSRKMYPGEWR